MHCESKYTFLETVFYIASVALLRETLFHIARITGICFRLDWAPHLNPTAPTCAAYELSARLED